MAATDLSTTPAIAIAATSSASAAPGGGDAGYATGRFSRVRTLCKYVGTVSSAAIQLWVRDQNGLEWFRGASTADTGPLTGSTNGNESRDWDVGKNQVVFFQLSAVAGGGTAEVRVMGVDA